MIKFYRLVYFGLYSYLESKNKEADRVSIMIYSNASRIALYSLLFIGLHYFQLFTINSDNKYYVIGGWVLFESLSIHFICGSKKHNQIEIAFDSLSVKTKNIYIILGVFLTPISLAITLILILVVAFAFN